MSYLTFSTRKIRIIPMSDEDSDPKIVKRLSNLPPFTDEEGNVTGTPPPQVSQEPQEEVVEPPIEPKEEPKEEVKEEVKEEPKEPTEEEALANAKNPKRTGEFIEKLKEQNKELKKNVLDSLMPENLPTPEPPQWPQPPITNVIPNQFPGVTKTQIDETFKGLVDENGYVDTGLLISTLNDLKEKNKLSEQRATQAEQKTQQVARKFEDFERNEVMKKVHEKFPSLNPESENFDERLWKFVRNEVVDQWMSGKETNVMAAAEEGMNTLHPEIMKKADKIKLEQAETAKRNINALGASQTTQRESYSDHEELVNATRLGKKGALAERLAKSGY